MEYFLIGDEVFFGFYRTDGVNLTKAQCKRLEKRIPDFFRGDGDIQNLSEYLSVARITLNDQGLDLLPQIFDYYLETIMFKPKTDWATFQQYYRHYLDHALLPEFAFIVAASACCNPYTEYLWHARAGLVWQPRPTKRFEGKQTAPPRICCVWLYVLY